MIPARAPTAAVAILAAAVAACSPLAAPVPDAAPTAAQACAARGGSIQRVGRLQSERCVVPFADAGRPCRDGDDCQGDCRAPEPGSPEGATVMGVCAPNDLPFGCHAPVEDGRARATLCVD